MKKANGHLVGNGPSRIHFKKYNVYDVAIGCNLSDIKVDAVTVVDPFMIDYISNNDVEHYPLIIPYAMKKRILKSQNKESVKIRTTLEQRANTNSSGHLALKYLIDHGFQHIHIWGCDSIFQETVDSCTHQQFPQQPVNQKNWVRWRRGYRLMFLENPDKQFTIHSDVQFNLKETLGDLLNVDLSVCNP